MVWQIKNDSPNLPNFLPTKLSCYTVVCDPLQMWFSLWFKLHLLLYLLAKNNMQIKNTLGIKKMQGQSDSAV